MRLSHEVGVIVHDDLEEHKKNIVRAKLRKGNDKKMHVLDEKQIKDC